MIARHVGRVALVAVSLAGVVPPASAEPRFLSKQYTRCTACHVIPSGGGLLTDYGRSLSHRELSTTGDRSGTSPDPAAPPGEEGFLFGALGRRLGPVALGIELRPSHVQTRFGGVSSGRNLLMAANVHGAVRMRDWTVYAQAGREPVSGGGRFVSYEHWAGWQPPHGFGFRAGRFLPAYGVRFADHTAYNRSWLGVGQGDQIYGVEVSHTTDRLLTQVAVGPGRAQAIPDDDGTRAVVAAGRFQVDLGPTMAVAVSGLHEGKSDAADGRTAAGVAFGYAPRPWLSTWTQVDRHATEGRADYIVVHEAALEAFRGVWLTVSPQFRIGGGDLRNDLRRIAIGTVLLPRTHLNVNVTYYRDWSEAADASAHVVLSQLHVYF
jgi:hypothetical protein